MLRVPPDARSGVVTALPTAPPHCSVTTINRKLSAVASFYQFHLRHGARAKRATPSKTLSTTQNA